MGSINIYLKVPSRSSCEFGSLGYSLRKLIFDILVCSINFLSVIFFIVSGIIH
jgi:hypothetical protein